MVSSLNNVYYYGEGGRERERGREGGREIVKEGDRERGRQGVEKVVEREERR